MAAGVVVLMGAAGAGPLLLLLIMDVAAAAALLANSRVAEDSRFGGMTGLFGGIGGGTPLLLVGSAGVPVAIYFFVILFPAPVAFDAEANCCCCDG